MKKKTTMTKTTIENKATGITTTLISNGTATAVRVVSIYDNKQTPERKVKSLSEVLYSLCNPLNN